MQSSAAGESTVCTAPTECALPLERARPQSRGGVQMQAASDAWISGHRIVRAASRIRAADFLH